MPTIGFLGSLAILIYPDDHDPPHYHVLGGGIRLWVRIADAVILRESGNVTPRHRRLVRAWTAEHRDELLWNWNSIRAGTGRKMIR